MSVISLLFLFVFDIGQDHTPHHTTPHHTILSSRIPSLYIKCPPLSFRVKTAVASALLSVLVAMPGMTELVSEAAWLQITDETSQPASHHNWSRHPTLLQYSSLPGQQYKQLDNSIFNISTISVICLSLCQKSKRQSG